MISPPFANSSAASTSMRSVTEPVHWPGPRKAAKQGVSKFYYTKGVTHQREAILERVYLPARYHTFKFPLPQSRTEHGREQTSMESAWDKAAMAVMQ